MCLLSSWVALVWHDEPLMTLKLCGISELIWVNIGMAAGVGTAVSHEPEYDDFHGLHHAGEGNTALGDYR